MHAHKRTDGSVDVSSHLTRGRAATVWFDLDSKPHVMWAVTKTYRNGLTDEAILAAVTQRTGT